MYETAIIYIPCKETWGLYIDLSQDRTSEVSESVSNRILIANQMYIKNGTQ
jgi:hypothetical protein